MSPKKDPNPESRRPRGGSSGEERTRGHALWKGAVTFGLVEIPVALHSAAAREDEIQFTLLDRRDFSPVGYERVNKRTRDVVPWEEIVKGYEHEKGEYVVLTEDEVKAANPEASRTVEITAFVEAHEIESVYWETPYYLVPTNKKSKAYALLRETLTKTQRVGLARVVIRTRQRLAALTVRGPAIVLNVLRFAHELRDPEELDLPEAARATEGAASKELALAEQLVKSMSTRWKPEDFTDDYRKDILAMVQRKVKAGRTHEIEATPKERSKAAEGEVLDLMPLLRQSVERRVVGAERRRTPPKTVRRRGA